MVDPNAAYDELVDAIKAKDWDAATEIARGLWNWIVRGGFLPSRPEILYAIPDAKVAPGLRHLVGGISARIRQGF
jgi:hypothetical protein